MEKPSKPISETFEAAAKPRKPITNSDKPAKKPKAPISGSQSLVTPSGSDDITVDKRNGSGVSSEFKIVQDRAYDLLKKAVKSRKGQPEKAPLGDESSSGSQRISIIAAICCSATQIAIGLSGQSSHQKDELARGNFDEAKKRFENLFNSRDPSLPSLGKAAGENDILKHKSKWDASEDAKIKGHLNVKYGQLFETINVLTTNKDPEIEHLLCFIELVAITSAVGGLNYERKMECHFNNLLIQAKRQVEWLDNLDIPKDKREHREMVIYTIISALRELARFNGIEYSWISSTGSWRVDDWHKAVKSYSSNTIKNLTLSDVKICPHEE